MIKRNSIRRIITWSLMVCILTSQIGISAIAEVAEGSVLRLVEMTGSVSIESQNGKKIELRENMKLNSGNSLKTAKASYAYVSLDDTKAVKLDALSQAQIRKSGKRLEVLLESGNLFFNVAAPLAADENLNIRTSTTVTGIRGTTGYVEIKNEKETVVCLLEGTIICRGIDPVDGQIKDFVILPGQKAVFSNRENNDIPEIVLSWLSENDIPGYIAVEIKKNEDLQRKITEQTNLSVPLIVGTAEERLRQDEGAAGAELDIVNKKLGEQGQNKKTEPVFFDTSRDSSDKSGNGSDTPDTPDNPDTPDEPEDPPPADIITREMPISVGELNTLLESNDVVLISNTGSQMLVLDSGLLVPLGRKLTLSAGVPLMVNSETALSVDGTIEVEEPITNKGAVKNTGTNTFLAKGGMTNGETGSIDNTGRFVVTGDLTNSGMLVNQNRFEVSGTLHNLPGGQMNNSGTIKAAIECTGRFEITEGTFDRINQTAGLLLLSGGIVNGGISIGEAAEFSMSGGTVNPGDEGWGILINGSGRITGGTVNGKDGENDAAIILESGFLELDGGKIRGKTPKSFVKLGDSAYMMYKGEEISGDVRFNMLRDGDSYVPGGYFTNLGDAFEGAASGEIVMALPGDVLENADPENYGHMLILKAGEPDNPVVLDLNGQDVEVLDMLVIGPLGARSFRSGIENYSAVLKVNDSKKTGSLFLDRNNNEYSSYVFSIQSNAKLEVTNCKITSDLGAITLQPDSILRLGRNSHIQISKDDGETPAVYRRDGTSEVEFAGGTVSNEGEGIVFLDGEMIGLPKENMNTEIRGRGENLFYCVTSEQGFYIPENYDITSMDDGYYHVIPMSEPQQELFMSPAPKSNNAPKPASPSEAGMEDMEDMEDSTKPDDGRQKDLPDMKEGEVFLLPEPDKGENFSEGEEEIA